MKQHLCTISGKTNFSSFRTGKPISSKASAVFNQENGFAFLQHPYFPADLISYVAEYEPYFSAGQNSGVVSFTTATRLQRPSQKSTNVAGPYEEARHLPVKCIPPQASDNHTEIGISRIRKFIRFTTKSDQDNVRYPFCGPFVVSSWAEDKPEYYGMENVDSAIGLSKKRRFLGGDLLF